MNGQSRREPLTLERIRVKFGHVTGALRITWQAASRWTIAWSVFLVLQGIVPALTVYLTKVLVDAVTAAVGGGADWTSLQPILGPAGAMVAVLLLDPVLRNAGNWVRAAQGEYVTDYIKQLIHEKTAAVDLEFYDVPEYFDDMSRANSEADRRVLSILENTGSLARNTISIVAIAGILLPYGWWVPLVLVGSTFPALWIVVTHQRIYHAWWRSTTEDRRWARYYDRIVTERASAQEVRLFGLSEQFRELYQSVRKRLRKSHIRLIRNQRIASVSAVTIALLGTGAIMAWMVARALRGLSTLGDIALFYQAFKQGQSLMQTMLGNLGTLYADALFLEHLFSFLDLEPRVHAPENPLPVPVRLRKGIVVRDVTFRYPGSESMALKDFSMELPAGKTVAIVGKNGAGKSTLIKLLCRFYDPASGRVTWDGVDIRDFDPQELWRHTTVLFQHPVNYAGTVEEAIRYGEVDSEPASNRVVAAVEAAGANGVVEKLPYGLETMLGKEFDGGVDLSGGEWQRIALARAFYRQAPLVLLDEPTSFMDSWAEMQWLDRFRLLVKDRTALIVTHRFTTAMRADLIYVMEAGSIVEQGTHEELLLHDGAYADSWHQQMDAEKSQMSSISQRDYV